MGVINQFVCKSVLFVSYKAEFYGQILNIHMHTYTYIYFFYMVYELMAPVVDMQHDSGDNLGYVPHV